MIALDVRAACAVLDAFVAELEATGQKELAARGRVCADRLAEIAEGIESDEEVDE